MMAMGASSGCGGQELMNPLLYSYWESRKLYMWPEPCKYICGAAADDKWNQLSLRASAGFLWGQEQAFVTLQDKCHEVFWFGVSPLQSSD